MTREEIKKILDNTKVYVNGKSQAIQEKLFSFGYDWSPINHRVIKNITEPFLFIDKNGNEVTINNANAKEFIQHEREAVDDLITGVINEVASGEITLPDLPEDDLAA